MDCTFCKVVSGEVKAYSVFEDDDCFAFLDHKPLFPGHILLLPKKHYETLSDLPTSLVPAVFGNAKLLAAAIQTAMRAEGSFVAINNRVSQSVPHLHVHIVPRRKGDGLKGFFWPRQKYNSEDEMLAVQKSIRETVHLLSKNNR